jgi:ribosomal protein S18 acetylase RimI-like enzyme
MDNFQIRPFNPADREFILGLLPRFVEFGLPPWREAESINRTNANLLEAALEALPADSAILVAEDNAGTPLGFIHLQTNSDYFSGEPYAYISDVAVAPQGEGQGIGRALMLAAEAWANQQGYGLLALYVFAQNERAKRLYESLGYAQEIIKYVKRIQD